MRTAATEASTDGGAAAGNYCDLSLSPPSQLEGLYRCGIVIDIRKNVGRRPFPIRVIFPLVGTASRDTDIYLCTEVSPRDRNDESTVSLAGRGLGHVGEMSVRARLSMKIRIAEEGAIVRDQTTYTRSTSRHSTLHQQASPGSPAVWSRVTPPASQRYDGHIYFVPCRAGAAGLTHPRAPYPYRLSL